MAAHTHPPDATPPEGLSIVIPMFNEAARAPATLRAVSAYFTASRCVHEILVVDDGSTDGTAAGIEALGLPAVVVLRLQTNRGKGAAVKAGMLAARHPWILMTDADLSTPIEEFARLSSAIRSGADIAIGSRAVEGARVEVHQHAARERAGRVFNGVVRQLLLPDIHDTQCGFKLFTRAAAREVFARSCVEGFSFDAEALFLARRARFVITEVPVCWRNDPSTRVSLVSGARAFLDLVRIWLLALAGRYGPVINRSSS